MMIRSKKNPSPGGILVLALVLLLGTGVRMLLRESPESAVLVHNPSYVQVDGNIRFPGVYPFDTNRPTLQLLVKKAGGLKGRKRDLEALRGDIPISHGTRITLLGSGEKEGFRRGEMDPFYKVSLGIPLSVNKASELDLIAVPGIGPRLADAIVRERARRGKFLSLQEIREIRGINQGIYRKVRPYLTL
ncbi:MAG: helix-hairpin-helix domain-containing protein [Deltaproteobacteria bacterium]|nr:helix-hairpin-helix domain-containing protein [Deltaproteobacteria bacterium]MBW2137597.1 helix-hairpin-helix domain-containing protein [Deltaproteobacteria bacterium]